MGISPSQYDASVFHEIRRALLRKLLKIAAWMATIAFAVIVVSVLYSTYTGRVTWYFRVDGSVTIDGRKTTGYLHADSRKTMLLVTRTDEPRRETYLFLLQGGTRITDCGDWNPPRFLPAAIGDMEPPCIFADPARVVDAPVNGSLVLERRSVEFRTASGKRVKAEW